MAVFAKHIQGTGPTQGFIWMGQGLTKIKLGYVVVGWPIGPPVGGRVPNHLVCPQRVCFFSSSPLKCFLDLVQNDSVEQSEQASMSILSRLLFHSENALEGGVGWVGSGQASFKLEDPPGGFRPRWGFRAGGLSMTSANRLNFFLGKCFLCDCGGETVLGWLGGVDPP